MNVSVSQVTIDAARRTVSAFVTDPVLVRQWQYESTLATEWRLAGRNRTLLGYEGQASEQRGNVLASEVPRRLSYSLFDPRPRLSDVTEDRFTMTYDVDDVDRATGLTIAQTHRREGDFEPLAVDEENPVLVALTSLVETLEAHGSP